MAFDSDESSTTHAPASASRLLSNRSLFIASAIVFAIFTVAYSGPVYWATVFATTVISGGIALGMVLSGAAAGALLLRAARVAVQDALAAATAVGIGLGVQGLAVLGLGLAGWMNRAMAIAIELGPILLWIALFAANRRSQGDRRGSTSIRDALTSRLRQPAGWNWLWLALIPALSVAATAACILPGWLWWPYDPQPYDVLCYHLQVPREWYQLGRIVPLHHNVFCFFPFQTEMLYLLAMHLFGGPWSAMYVSQFLSLLLVILTLVAVYATISLTLKSTGVTGATAHAAGVIGAVAAGTPPWMAMIGSVAYVEPLMLLYATAAVGWMLQAILSDGHSMRPFLLAGVMAGFACGVKYTSVPMTLAALPVAAIAAVATDRVGASRFRRALIGCVGFGIVGLVVVSPWLIRNFLQTGNPVFPLAMNLFGRGDFTEAQVRRFVLAHSRPPDEASIAGLLHALWHEVLYNWQYGYVLIPAGFIAAIASLRRRGMVFVLITLAIVTAVWLFFTHLMGRFLLPAAPLAAIAIGLASVGRRAMRIGATVALLAAAIGFLGLPFRAKDANAVGLGGCFREFAKIGRVGSFGESDVVVTVPPELQDFERNPEDPHGLAFIGDAEPYRHPIASSRIRYRTVFDVNIPDGGNVVDSWLGRSAAELRRTDWVVINVAELRRVAGSKERPGVYLLPPVPATIDAGDRIIDLRDAPDLIVLPPLNR